MSVTVIVVSWNVKDLLRRCLESVRASKIEREMRVVVVDNCSDDGTQTMVGSDFPEMKLIENQTNVGFAVANNQGLREATTDYVVLLNPDAEAAPRTISLMARYLDENPGVGVVGPRLLNPDGTVQSSRRRFPTLATAFVESTVLQRYFPTSNVLKRYYLLDQSDDLRQDVDWLVGACLMVRREAMEQVGGLDESFFMYSEEVDWCYRMKRAGWRVVYLPDAEVVHHYGQSSAKDVAQRHIRFNTSKYLFFRKHHSRLAAESIRLFLLLTFGFQMLAEGLKLGLRHKPELRRERLAILWQVMRSGLRA